MPSANTPTVDNLYGPAITDWTSSEPIAHLPADALHLWRIDLSRPELAEQAHPLLLADEQERVRRMRNAQTRNVYIVTRAAKRRILCAYLGIESHELVLRRAEKGKPFIGRPESSLRFNLTHSADIALLAVARSTELGLDLERIKSGKNRHPIAKRMFTADAAHQVAEAGDERQPGLFFYHWTRMEAGVKADGSGLAGAHAPRPEGMTLFSFVPERGYQACIAALGSLPPVEDWDAFIHRF